MAEEKTGVAAANLQMLTEQVLGSSQPEYLKQQMQARLLAGANKLTDAYAMFQSSLVSFASHRLQQLDVAFVPDTLNHMGCLLMRMGPRDAHRAIRTFQQAIERAQKAFGMQSKQVAEYSENLAVALQRVELWQQAARVYGELAHLYTDSLRDEFRAANAWFCMADSLNNDGAFEAAEAPARAALQIRRRLATGATMELIMSLSLVAVVISAPQLAQYDEAEDLLNEASKLAKVCQHKDFDQRSTLQRIATIMQAIKRARRNAAGPKPAAVADRPAAPAPEVKPRTVYTPELADANPCMSPGCKYVGKLTCARCKAAQYCSRECQKSDWKIHKADCDEAVQAQQDG